MLMHVRMKLKVLFSFIGFIVLMPLAWKIDDIPYTIEVTAKIYPSGKWVIVKDTDGSLVSTLYNYRNGIINDVKSYKLDNGDVAEMELIPKKAAGVHISKGDTVAILRSAVIDERIAVVRSQLEELKAYLKVDATGMKASEIALAKEQLTYAQQQLAFETENYNRALLLYQEKVIAPAEFNQVKTAFDLANTQVKIAHKTLETARTGVKPEQIKYTEARIETAKKELHTLLKKKSSLTLLAGVSGKINFNVTPDEVLTVEDTSAYILQFPVRLADRNYITSLAKISVEYPLGAAPMTGTLIDLSDKVEYMGGEQLVFAKAILPNKAEDISTGMFLRCQVECDRVNLAEYIVRVLRHSMK